MIPKLRKKFILIAAASLFAVILTVAFSIDLIFFLQSRDLLSGQLTVLMGQYGADSSAGEGTEPADVPPPADESAVPETGTKRRQPPRFPEEDGFSPGENHPFSLFPRFEDNLRVRVDGCVAVLDQNGEILQIRQDGSNSYSEEELEDLILTVSRKKASEGWCGYYRYRKQTDQTGEGEPVTVLALVNASSVLYSVFTVLFVSVLIGLLGFLAALLLIIFASGRAVRPIAESYEKQKQFVTDAGHELKTPLTVISADNQLARITFGDSEWFDGIDRQVERMNALVRSLIQLARMDEEQKPVFSVFSFSDAVYDTAKAFEHPILAKHRRLTLEIQENITCHGDESALRQLVSILMDNALKYSAEEGEIAVRLTADKAVRLQVTNDCASVEGFNPERVFERFYRADKARTSDGSYGLGLSIAQSIARLHRGEIRAEISGQNKVRFELTLPLGKSDRS